MEKIEQMLNNYDCNLICCYPGNFLKECHAGRNLFSLNDLYRISHPFSVLTDILLLNFLMLLFKCMYYLRFVKNCIVVFIK